MGFRIWTSDVGGVDSPKMVLYVRENNHNNSKDAMQILDLREPRREGHKKYLQKNISQDIVFVNADEWRIQVKGLVNWVITICVHRITEMCEKMVIFYTANLINVVISFWEILLFRYKLVITQAEISQVERSLLRDNISPEYCRKY